MEKNTTTTSPCEEDRLDVLATRLRHSVTIRDRLDESSWIRQIYHNTFVGSEALSVLKQYYANSRGTSEVSASAGKRRVKKKKSATSALITGATTAAAERAALTSLNKMLRLGLIHNAVKKHNKTFKARDYYFYRFRCDNKEDSTSFPTTPGSNEDTLEWYFTPHVKINSLMLGSTLGDWFENALRRGCANEVTSAVTAVRQRVLDAGRYGGTLLETDKRFRGCRWHVTGPPDKSNGITTMFLKGPAADGADYTCIRMTGFLQQPPHKAARLMGSPKFRERFGEMFQKSCRYVDVLERTRTRIRREEMSRSRSMSGTSGLRVSEKKELERAAVSNLLPTLTSEGDVSCGGRFFTSAVGLPSLPSMPKSTGVDTDERTLSKLESAKWLDEERFYTASGTVDDDGVGGGGGVVREKPDRKLLECGNGSLTSSSSSSSSSGLEIAKKVTMLPLPLKINTRGASTKETMTTTTQTPIPAAAKASDEGESASVCGDVDASNARVETTRALTAIANLCVLYRRHKELSRLSKFFAGEFDSVLLNDTFQTSDNVWALWGTSVNHSRTPPRTSYNRMEVLFFCQCVEPIDGYPNLSRLTVTYQLKSNIIGALRHIQIRCGIGKGLKEFMSVQEQLQRPEIQKHLTRLEKGFASRIESETPSPSESPSASHDDLSASPRERTISSLLKSPLKPAGVQLSDFEILSVCGRGGFGKVLRVQRNHARNTDHRVYAMKVISKAKMMQKRQVNHVIVERKVLSRLSGLTQKKSDDDDDDDDVDSEVCPFIVRLFYAFQTRTHLFLVMEFVAGGDLLTRLVKRGRLSMRLCKIYGGEIVLALEHLHRLGIVYRDMKPENILISKEGHLKLADFGVSYIRESGETKSGCGKCKAKKKDEDTMGEGSDGPHSFVGTEVYMSPEIISQAVRARRRGKGRSMRSTKPYDGPAVDFWGFGVVLYNMLTARHPFITGRGKSGNSRVETLQNIMNPEFVPRYLKDIGNASTSAELLLTSLFVRDPRRRLKGSLVRNHSFFASVDFAALSRMKIDLPKEARSSIRMTTSPVTGSSGDRNNDDAPPVPYEREYSSLLSAIQSTHMGGCDDSDGDRDKVAISRGSVEDGSEQSFYHEMDIFHGFTYNAEAENATDIFDLVASDIPSTPPGSPKSPGRRRTP